MLRRVQIESDDIGCLAFKFRVNAAKVALEPMRPHLACANIRCTVNLLTPSSSASLRREQEALPSEGFFCARRITQPRITGVASPDLLP